MTRLAIHYRREFFGESTAVTLAGDARPGTPRGLVGRQVANAEMLSALLRHGSDESLSFLVDNDQDNAELRLTLRNLLPANKQAVIKSIRSLDHWLQATDRCVFWEPQPPSASLAWARSRIGCENVALGGVTHTLSSALAASALRDLVASPLRNSDRLVCTSVAVAHTARVLIDHWSGVVGKPLDPEMIQLETIPLGVDCERHRPATAEQRRDVRERLSIPEHADVVLFVGRLSHHAKSNPLPMFAACQHAAERTGRPVYLILAGWYAAKPIQDAFENGAAQVAPDVNLLQVNAMDDRWRDSVWDAADLFISLADSVQETFGLTVVEAMSRGIAVVASDWNGYRETIKHDETGLLVPTSMVLGAAEKALIAMHEGRLSYDQFLAAVGQTVNVETRAACDAVTRLLCEPKLRERMAAAGRQHAEQNFSWSAIIGRYEDLWNEQRELIRKQHIRLVRRANAEADQQESDDSRSRQTRIIPPLRDLFFQYPTRWIGADRETVIGSCTYGDLQTLTDSPLANHAAQWRRDLSVTQALLDQAVEPNQTGRHDQSPEDIDTIAWAQKFDLLRVPMDAAKAGGPRVRSLDVGTDLTFTLTCMGRLEHLQQSLPRLVSQPRCHVVVTDYSCPDNSGQWIRDNFSSDQVTVIDVPGRTHFDRSEAKNFSIVGAGTRWICVIDADVLVTDDFSAEVHKRLVPNRILRCVTEDQGVGGTFVASREAVMRVGCHDLNYREWGEEDDDLIDALFFIGHKLAELPERLIQHIPHDDGERMKFHQSDERKLSWLVNRIYRAAKWDIAKVLGDVPSLKERENLYRKIHDQIAAAIESKSTSKVEIPLGQKDWKKLAAVIYRSLQYRIESYGESPDAT